MNWTSPLLDDAAISSQSWDRISPRTGCGCQPRRTPEARWRRTGPPPPRRGPAPAGTAALQGRRSWEPARSGNACTGQQADKCLGHGAVIDGQLTGLMPVFVLSAEPYQISPPRRGQRNCQHNNAVVCCQRQRCPGFRQLCLASDVPQRCRCAAPSQLYCPDHDPEHSRHATVSPPGRRP